MKQQYVASNFDLHRGNQVYATDQAKVDAFTEAFAEARDSENLPADMRQFRRKREAVYSDPVASRKPSPRPVTLKTSPLTCASSDAKGRQSTPIRWQITTPTMHPTP